MADICVFVLYQLVFVYLCSSGTRAACVASSGQRLSDSSVTSANQDSATDVRPAVAKGNVYCLLTLCHCIHCLVSLSFASVLLTVYTLLAVCIQLLIDSL